MCLLLFLCVYHCMLLSFAVNCFEGVPVLGRKVCVVLSLRRQAVAPNSFEHCFHKQALVHNICPSVTTSMSEKIVECFFLVLEKDCFKTHLVCEGTKICGCSGSHHVLFTTRWWNCLVLQKPCVQLR